MHKKNTIKKKFKNEAEKKPIKRYFLYKRFLGITKKNVFKY